MSEIVEFKLQQQSYCLYRCEWQPVVQRERCSNHIGIYKYAKKAIIDNVDDEDKKRKLEDLNGCLSSPHHGLQRPKHRVYYINEPGLYSLICGSKYNVEGLRLSSGGSRSEVLALYQEHGRYETPVAAIERIRNPHGRDEAALQGEGAHRDDLPLRDHLGGVRREPDHRLHPYGQQG